MTIPHVAIVSSFLLAGDNTKVWQAAAHGCTTTKPDNLSRKHSVTKAHATRSSTWLAANGHDSDPIEMPFNSLQHRIYQTVSQSAYRHAWLWDRGSNKAMWINQLSNEYPNLKNLSKDILHFDLFRWLFYIIIPTMGLTLFPSLIAVMVRLVDGIMNVQILLG